MGFPALHHHFGAHHKGFLKISTPSSSGIPPRLRPTAARIQREQARQALTTPEEPGKPLVPDPAPLPTHQHSNPRPKPKTSIHPHLSSQSSQIKTHIPRPSTSTLLPQPSASTLQPSTSPPPSPPPLPPPPPSTPSIPMATPTTMPVRGHSTAPKFDPTQPRKL